MVGEEGNQRFFKFYRETELRALLERNSFEIIEIDVQPEIGTGRENNWVYAFARKNPHAFRPQTEVILVQEPPLNLQSSLIVPAKIANAENVLQSLSDKARFKEIIRGIYPEDLIRKMQQEGYDPIVIGYDHGISSNLPAIKGVFAQILAANPGRTIKVAIETLWPIQLQWIKDFLGHEREY